jgi:NADH-quinone oxidoreductase subunit M
MTTVLLILLPLAACLLMLLVSGENAKRAALGLALVEFALSLYAISQVGQNPNTLALDIPWMSFGEYGWHFCLDGAFDHAFDAIDCPLIV